ncbi:Cytoplasmic dynein 1 heavy chain 1 [Bienertia sinuspersici]
MSYHSKRTRAISLSNDSHAANDASQGPPKKTSMSISTTSLHNAASQQQKEPITTPKLDIKQKVAAYARKFGGIWKSSPGGSVESQKSEEVDSQQSLRVEKRLEKAAKLSNLPPMAPKNNQSYKATNSLTQNVCSSSPHPMKKHQEVASHESLSVESKLDEVGEISDLPPMVLKKIHSSKTTNPLKHKFSSSYQSSLKQSSFSNQSKQPCSKQQAIGGNTKMNFQASSSRRRSLIPSWILDKPDFDDIVDVVTINAEGNHSLVSGSIQAVDIWNNNGVRYYVQFNELHQPIRKGGQLLVKLIGSIAKHEHFCPVGELDWHHIDDVFLADMINVIRDRFVIPNGEIYINKILSRIAKVWRQYKSHLKSLYFKPQERSQEEHYNTIPCGISRDNWRKLVKYWFSKKGKEDKHGEEMSLVQLYDDVHMRKDGRFIEGTQAQDFLVFKSLMYGGEPPKRPKGFGFGVVKSNIYGVHGLLRKEGHGKVHKRPLENVNITVAKNEELVKQNEVLEERVNQNTMLIMSLLEAMRNGKPSTELIDAAQSSLRVANLKVVRDASSTPNESKDAPSSSNYP